MVRFAGVAAADLVVPAGFAPFLAFAHLACCASAIFRREAAETTRAG
jgi:hypothetical protein